MCCLQDNFSYINSLSVGYIALLMTFYFVIQNTYQRHLYYSNKKHKEVFMSALEKKNAEVKIDREEKRLSHDINLVYDFTEKPNRTKLKAHSDRAVVAKLRADLVLPSNKILTVDIEFDSPSSYHNNTMMIMDDYGVEMLATAFEVKYGKKQADAVLQAWSEKKHLDDPRKPTYMLVQKPNDQHSLPKIFVACGEKDHENDIAKNIV